MRIERGGKNEERLYLYDDEFDLGEDHVVIKRTDMSDIKTIIQRHRSRYSLLAFFYRRGMKVLDFPCGSGYAIFCFYIEDKIHAEINFEYEGRDNDLPTIEYCKRQHSPYGSYIQDYLTDPHLPPNEYDLIACIEGIEHIDGKYQRPLIKAFYEALKPNGVLVVSSPENPEGISGPSKTNPYHLWELSEWDFLKLLNGTFPWTSTRVIFTKDILHNGQKATCLYGICRKEG